MPESWSEQHGRRREVARRFPARCRLPVIRRASRVVLAEIASGARVLEVGAGDRRLEKRLGEVRYASVDPDPAGEHDWARVDDVPEDASWDAILCFELVEHLPAADLPDFLAALSRRLAPGGTLYVSTPNIAHTDPRGSRTWTTRRRWRTTSWAA